MTTEQTTTERLVEAAKLSETILKNLLAFPGGVKMVIDSTLQVSHLALCGHMQELRESIAAHEAQPSLDREALTQTRQALGRTLAERDEALEALADCISLCETGDHAWTMEHTDKLTAARAVLEERFQILAWRHVEKNWTPEELEVASGYITEEYAALVAAAEWVVNAVGFDNRYRREIEIGRLRAELARVKGKEQTV